MPIDPNEIKIDKRIAPADISKDFESPLKYVSGMIDTLKNIGKVYPAFEIAATMATATYGVPISGLIGLAALPFGADNANEAIKAVQKFLVYQPQTEGGQQLTQAASYPTEKLAEAGKWVGEKFDNPIAGAIGSAIVEGAPALLQIPGASARMPKFTNVVEKGINKGVRPSVVKKEMWSQRDKYMQNANVAVDEIINNKQNLKLLDREGNKKTGQLPSTLEEFSQALEQTKRQIYSEYDSLATQAHNQGAMINMAPIATELDGIINSRVMQTVDPNTIKYALERKSAFENKQFSAKETQEIIQVLNQSEKAYYANPTPEMKGKAYVDSLIANNLRAGLDAAIESATGIEYAPLKRKYGSLRMLETDVTKRAIVDARKNIRGLIDFSDIFSSSQLMQGLVAQQPALLASGATIKGASAIIKFINDPNRIVKSMFKKAEKYQMYDEGRKITITPGTVMGAMSGETEEE